MNNEVKIRIVCADDEENLLKIYSPYIEKTAVTFEYAPPTVAEFRARIEKTVSRFPYLAAEYCGNIIGYAYAGYYIPRAACDRACEVSIYLAEEARGMGLGKMLYSKLFEILSCQNITNIYASVAFAEKEDEYLSHASARFHSKMGFSEIGRFRKCGCKFGRWYDLIWFEKFIGSHETAKEFLPFPAIAANIQF
ncbi:MAG: N-acetyltransferase [Clostridia bacterium]|nr:N-acetyltransferase [Clostridia bacterium]